MKKQTTKRTVKHNRPVARGMKGIAQSFLNVGIPVVMETQLNSDCRGMSAYLSNNGNTPKRLGHAIKIKL
ncbi:MAG: hypothetical protein IJV07_02550 [Alphaproteobacteria bacterium]|nr:hypothetical protein [Alphaproteobacteria bacterium]